MKKIKMQLFGRFFLADGDVVLGEEEIRSNKMTRLLVYILINRDKVLSHQKLIEVFFGNNSRKPENALKNQMYLIRRALERLGSEKYILTMPEAYRWNPEIEVETDYEQFEKNVLKLKNQKLSPEEKKLLCGEILSGYRGNITAKIADQSWISTKVTWYQSMYVDTVKCLCSILEEEKAWAELEQLCNEMLHIDSLDEEIHAWLMVSMQEQKKYDLALSQYEKASRYIYENIGIRHPQKIQEAYLKMLSRSDEEVSDMKGVLEETRETENPQGAFFCSYQIFRQIYRLEVRRQERCQMDEYLILLTLKRKGKVKSGKKVDPLLIDGMNTLEKVLCSNLRTGDVLSRYGPTQFIVLLSLCSGESGVRVAKRIEKAFHSTYGKGSIMLEYELEAVKGNSIIENTDRM